MNVSEYLQHFDRQFLLTGFAVSLTMGYAIVAKGFLTQARSRRERSQYDLFAAISNGLLSGTLETVDDLVNVYKGVHGLGADDISYRAGLSRVLREYLVRLAANSSLDRSEAKRLKDHVTTILKQIEEDAPFIELPAAERNLIIDIDRFVHVGDKDSAAKKLEDLAGLIEVRQDAFKKLQSSNKWSIPLATIGLVLTVIFGVLSLI